VRQGDQVRGAARPGLTFQIRPTSASTRLCDGILWTGASPTTAYQRTGWRVVMRSRAKTAHEASRPPVPQCVRRRRPTKTAIWPRRDVIGRFARCGRSHHEWVVMLVPVLRGRAAVTLGHKTSSLGRTARSPRLWLRPGRAPSRDARHWDMAVVRFAVLSCRVSDMKASPSRSTLRRKIEAASRARTSGRTPGICPAQLPCRSMQRACWRVGKVVSAAYSGVLADLDDCRQAFLGIVLR